MNDQPSLSEIRRIELDGVSDEMWSCRAPAGLAEADDTMYGPATDYGAETATLEGTTNFPGELWGAAVTGWTMNLDNLDPQAAFMVSYTITIQGADTAGTVDGTASLRSR